jgi:hypothetical protein
VTTAYGQVGDKVTREDLITAAQGGKKIASKSTPENKEDATDKVDQAPPVFKWPESLSTDTHPVTVMFSAYKIDPIAQTEIAQNLSKLSQKVRESFSSPEEKSESETVSEEKEEGKDERGLLGTAWDTAKSLKTAGKLNSYENFTKGDKVGSVQLPLQQGITINDGVSYTAANTNFGAGLIKAATSDQGDKINGVTNKLISQLAVKGAGTAAAGLAGGLIAGGAGALVAGAAGGDIFENISNATKEASRVTSNPNTRTLFEAVDMRSFQFTFKLIAKSENEAKQIKDIVKFFRREVYPEAINVDGVPFAYEFPNIFDIKVRDRSGQNNPGFDFQRSYLQSVATNFNQTAAGSMYAGKDRDYFIEVDVALSFTEFATMDKAKVRDKGL